MSAYTSLRVTRSKAKQKLMEHMMGEITDKQLEQFMDQLLEGRLYNAVIVPDDAENDDEVV